MRNEKSSMFYGFRSGWLQVIGGSKFSERFTYARLVQPVATRGETDKAFGTAVGVGSSSITAYRRADNPPPADRVLAIAKRCGVDPGWLAFGAETSALAPGEYGDWLAAKLPPPAPTKLFKEQRVVVGAKLKRRG